MSESRIVRIAMWSGPRNISTAMMRAFENRSDTAVTDEPFYAAYLQATGLDHPMRDEILGAQATDPATVIAALEGEVPGGRPIWYQKHMTHHMLPSFDRAWIDGFSNAFLIRAPEAVLASYVKKRSAVSLEEIGLIQQVEVFDRVADRLGRAPPVLDSEDILADPKGALTLLCSGCGIPFQNEMLSWPSGPRDSDGVWAPAWYDQVLTTTGFDRLTRAPHSGDLEEVLKRVAERARPFYERLARHRMTISQ